MGSGLVALALLGLRVVAAQAGEPAPFWQAFSGSWVSEASYVDARMRPIVARYATLTRVVADDDAIVITEWKFYPDGELARGMAGGKLPAGRGLETVTRSIGRADASDPDVLDFGAGRGRWTTTGAELAAGVVPGQGAAPRYRFVVALSGATHAVYATYGHADDGDLKSMALFRMRRIAPSEEPARLEALRQEFAVGLTLDSRDAAPR